MKQVVKNIFIILTVSEKQKLWLLSAADVVSSLLDIVFLIALLFVVNFYTQPFHTVNNRYFSTALFNAHPVLLVTIFFILFAGKNIFGFIVSKMQFRFVYGVASRISRENLTQYLQDSYLNYVIIDSSVVNRKISQEPIEFGHYVLNGVQQVFSQTVLVVITIVAVLIFNPLIFPLLILLLAPPVFLIAFLMKRKLDSTSVNAKKTSEKAMQHLQEALSGYIESNVYQKKDFFINRYHRLQVKLNHYLSDRLVIQNMPSRLIEVFAVFGLLILVIINSMDSYNHSIALVKIGALMIAAYKIIPGIVKITNTIGQVKTYSVAAADLAAAPRLPLITVFNNEPVNSIVFENIYFNYPGKKGIESLSFAMKKGDFMVISGISGRGKTSFINLLLGFLTPSSGNILINDKLTDDKTRQLYWNKIAYVKQQNFFLHASVIDNICLLEAENDETKLKKIAAITGIDKLVNTFPQGLNTIITENGKNFSGGQRQRIIFARALYKNADLLILDEPFNELDESSEIEMLNELQKLSVEGKMIILVTHNKAATSFGNKKILMDGQQ